MSIDTIRPIFLRIKPDIVINAHKIICIETGTAIASVHMENGDSHSVRRDHIDKFLTSEWQLTINFTDE